MKSFKRFLAEDYKKVTEFLKIDRMLFESNEKTFDISESDTSDELNRRRESRMSLDDVRNNIA